MVRELDVVRYLEADLRTAGLRGRVIANNIANLSTPGFRRGDVAFEDYLAKAMESGSPVDPAALASKVFQPMTTPVRADGNDVNLDMEVGELIKSGAQYKTYLRLLAKVYRQMEIAMSGEGR